jgi:hypothetical protein
MSLKTRSSAAFWLDDCALIFVPYGHRDETKTLPCAKPYSVSKALTPDTQLKHSTGQKTLDLSDGRSRGG